MVKEQSQFILNDPYFCQQSNLSKMIFEACGQDTFYHQPNRWDQHFYVIDITVPGILYNDDILSIQHSVGEDLTNNYFFQLVMETNGQWVPIINESTLKNVAFELKIKPFQSNSIIPIFVASMSSYHMYISKIGKELNNVFDSKFI